MLWILREKAYFFFSTRKCSINACTEIVGISIHNKGKSHLHGKRPGSTSVISAVYCGGTIG